MRKNRTLITWLIVIGFITGLLVYINIIPEVNEYSCTISGVRGGIEGFRIVQVSDVHGAVLGKNNARLIKAVEAQTPDMIAITGDLIENENQMADAKALVAQLCAVAPVYYVTGNHEWAAGLAMEVKNMVVDCGGTVLSNAYVVINSGGSEIVIAGCDDPNGYADQKTPKALLGEIEAASPDLPIVFLYHRNHGLEALAGADLVLCGHGHGSPVRLQGYKLVLETYRSGIYHLDGMTICVSRGLGSSILPMRLTRIHLPVVILTAK